jgi:hypothetical protein
MERHRKQHVKSVDNDLALSCNRVEEGTHSRSSVAKAYRPALHSALCTLDRRTARKGAQCCESAKVKELEKPKSCYSEFVVPWGRKKSETRRTVLRDILTLRERRLLRRCRKRLDGGLEKGRVLRSRNYEGNLPIRPSASMKDSRIGKGWIELKERPNIRGRIAHNTDRDVS